MKSLRPELPTQVTQTLTTLIYLATLTAPILISVLMVPGVAAQTPVGSSKGSVEGLVLDVDLKPVPEAMVELVPEEDMLHGGRFTKADSLGRFTFDNQPAGFVYLDAWKKADGYPHYAFSFNLEPGTILPRVQVKAGEAVRGVAIHLGERPAYLKFAITDEAGKPVNAGIRCYRPDQGDRGDYGSGVSANDTIPVPIVPFKISVEADGFETWRYGQEPGQNKDGLITLHSGETLSLRIRLKRRP